MLLAKSRLVVAGLDVAQRGLQRRSPATAASGFDRRAAEGEWVDPGTELASVDGPAAAAPHCRTDSPEPAAADVRHCHGHPPLRGRGRWPPDDSRHAQDDADDAGDREVRGASGRRDQPSLRAVRPGPHQGQPCAAGRRDCPCDCRSAPARTGLDGRDRSPDSCRSHRSGGRGCGHHPPRQPDDA